MTGWRCFHCDETFTEESEARVHFGSDEMREPGCVEKVAGGELGLLMRVRALEAELQAFYSETDAVTVYVQGLQADHAHKLVAAEQKGYDKGVADMREERNDALRNAKAVIDAAKPFLKAVKGADRLYCHWDANGALVPGVGDATRLHAPAKEWRAFEAAVEESWTLLTGAIRMAFGEDTIPAPASDRAAPWSPATTLEPLREEGRRP